jgi:CspA family cold shock protein
MGRGRDFRGGGKGRRSFEEETPDFYTPSEPYQARPTAPMSSAAEGTPADAVVKWFNSEKGFGFVEATDGSGDAFLHVKLIQGLGQESVSPGTKMSVLVGQGQKGRQVTKVLSIDDSVGAPVPPRPAPPAGRPPRQQSAPDASSATEMLGTVKWFSVEKGMGFIAVDGGGKDVFVHISIVERSQLPNLAEGCRVALRVIETQKGRQAVSITPAG